MTELEQKNDNSVYMDNLTSKVIDLEKENAELKKENADLKTRLQITEHRAQMNFDESAEAESKLRELEKENKALKEANEHQVLIIEQKERAIRLAIEDCNKYMAQIEEMKCCWNCKNYNSECEYCKLDKSLRSFWDDCDKWELAE